MYPHAAGLIEIADQQVFEEVRATLTRPEWFTEPTSDPTCHELARAVADVWRQLHVVDGRFCGRWDHSWLLTPNDNIIDVYPIAIIGGPILLDNIRGPWSTLYDVCPLLGKIDMIKVGYFSQFIRDLRQFGDLRQTI